MKISCHTPIFRRSSIYGVDAIKGLGGMESPPDQSRFKMLVAARARHNRFRGDRLADRPGWRNGKRGRLKIAWLRPCRFESCSGHHPSFTRHFMRSIDLIKHTCPDVVGRQQVFECVTVE